jgi:hypothetical protein
MRWQVALALLLSACTDRVIVGAGDCDGDPLAEGVPCWNLGDSLTIPIDFTPLSLRAARFTADDRASILVMGTAPTGVVTSALYSYADGGFGAPQRPSLYGCSAHPVAGELDDDAISDLLVDDCGEAVLLFHGTADGEFSGPVLHPMPGLTRTSAIADLDHDGYGDIVLLGVDPTSGAWQLSTAKGGPDGQAVATIATASASDGFDPAGFSLGDITGDGYDDAVLVAPGILDSARLVAGNRNGLAGSEPIDIGVVADRLSVAPLDENDALDVVVVSSVERGLVTLLGPRLRAGPKTSVPGLEVLKLSAVYDIDRDGLSDVVLVYEDRLDVWQAAGDGSFSRAATHVLDQPTEQIALADLDGDGATDLILGTFAMSTLQVVLAIR